MTPTELAQLRADAEFLLSEFHMPNEEAVHRLARAFLAANREGDDLEVTADWLRLLPGMVDRGEGDFSMAVPKSPSGQIYFNAPSRPDGETDYYLHYASFGMAGVPMPDIYKTRGAILKLLAGLGLEAKERG